MVYIDKETPYHACASRVRRLMHLHHIYASIRIAKHDRKAERKDIISVINY
ncbi:hypothetical protein ACNAN0_07335 [Agrilactobacillus fermenti]|uniref:hypothetical protein n=1 Tax=Agrilactobacillus fermenti TaxID=2586909 RepID=UPI003A5C607C